MDRENGLCKAGSAPSIATVISLYIVHAVVICILPITLILYFNTNISKYLKNQNGQVVLSNVQEKSIYARNKRALANLNCMTVVASVTVFVPSVILTILYVVFIIEGNHNY